MSAFKPSLRQNEVEKPEFFRLFDRSIEFQAIEKQSQDKTSEDNVGKSGVSADKSTS